MIEDAQLARFQAVLLDLLDSELSPREIRERLLEHEAVAPYRDYVRGFEPRCLEIGSRLVKQWGVRRSEM
jgi:hypothetical protein